MPGKEKKPIAKTEKLLSGFNESFYQMTSEQSENEEEYQRGAGATQGNPINSAYDRAPSPSHVDHSTTPHSYVYCDVCVIC
jgi:hypothetical protein